MATANRPVPSGTCIYVMDRLTKDRPTGWLRGEAWRLDDSMRLLQVDFARRGFGKRAGALTIVCPAREHDYLLSESVAVFYVTLLPEVVYAPKLKFG